MADDPTARIIPQTVGDPVVVVEHELVPAGAADSGALGSQASAGGGVEGFVFTVDDYVDATDFTSALIQYANKVKEAGGGPPPWNLWQKNAHAIAVHFSEETLSLIHI